MICLSNMKDKPFHERFGKRDYIIEVKRAIFTLEVLIVQANNLYYDSSDKESFISDAQYDDLTKGVACLYNSVGIKRDMKDFGYQFKKPEIHNCVSINGTITVNELDNMLK